LSRHSRMITQSRLGPRFTGVAEGGPFRGFEPGEGGAIRLRPPAEGPSPSPPPLLPPPPGVNVPEPLPDDPVALWLPPSEFPEFGGVALEPPE
jgi:hypothetical protein